MFAQHAKGPSERALSRLVQYMQYGIYFFSVGDHWGELSGDLSNLSFADLLHWYYAVHSIWILRLVDFLNFTQPSDSRIV